LIGDLVDFVSGRTPQAQDQDVIDAVTASALITPLI
jgi:hypothetical protein